MSDIMTIVLGGASIILLLLAGASTDAARRSFRRRYIKPTLRWGASQSWLLC